MTKNTPSPTTITRPISCALEGPAPFIASGSSPSSAAPSSAPVAKLTKCGRMRALRSSGTHRNATANAALAMPPRAANRTIHSSSTARVLCFSVCQLIVARTLEADGEHSYQPDQRRHAPALPITAIRKKARRISICAPAAAEYRAHPGGAEPAPNERAQVALPAAAAVGAESGGGGRVVRQEGGTHLAPHLEVCRTDRGAQPGDEPRRRDGEPRHGR